MKSQSLNFAVLALASALAGCNSTTENSSSSTLGPTPGFNQRIPDEILTPDRVSTSIGTLEFFDGMPLPETTDLVYENLDRMRAVDAFLNLVPAASLEALRRGMAELGVDQSNSCVLFDGLMDSNSLFLTGNTDTVYVSSFLDLDRDGPTVVEIPPGAGPGTVNDAYFRFVTDMGAPGPDRGKGGKYLILPPNYDGDIPEGYFVTKSSSFVNWVILRGFLKDGSTDSATAMWRENLRIYPLSEAGNPPEMKFVSGTGIAVNTIHANNYSFFEEVDHVIQREPIEFLDPELRGILSGIGIQKGSNFDPDDRLKAILTDAVAIANATARTLSFEPRSDTIFLYEGSKTWFTAFDGGDYRWLKDEGAGGRYLDARTLFFYLATVNTPAMVLKMVGAGSQYAICARDSAGEYMDGSESYKLTLPADVPAKDFWSIVVYDPQTRSMLQTDQPYPSKNNERNRDLVLNADGSTDLYFGPEAPAGHEKNWIQTVPGKAWFLCLRLYGPLESWFDKTWRPGEIEPLD
jgi:hypothetical protein